MEEAQQLSLLLDRAGHRNQYLFSDHYLNALLPRDPRWAAALPAATAFSEWLAVLYEEEGARNSPTTTSPN